MQPLTQRSAAAPPGRGCAKPVLAFLVTEDWYFLSHRLPMALAAQRAGYDVHVLTHCDRGAAAIAAHGFTLHELPWQRGNMDPRAVMGAVRAIRSVYRSLKPAIVHHVAVQPCVIGSLAAYGLPIRRVNAVAGFGSVYTSDSLKARIVRAAMPRLLKWALTQPGAIALVQNPDDRAALEALGVPPARIALVPGSGVDVDALPVLPEPSGPMTAAYVGRLLEDKGLRPLIAAQAELARRGVALRVLLAGEADPANPSSIPAQEIASWRRQPGIELLGHVADIRTVWAQAHIAVLPSRREGLPKSLLEAASCGRPMVATDVPGCREIARRDVTALLVPPDDTRALGDALQRLAGDGELRRRFGAAARAIVETEFSSARVGADIVALYGRLLAA
jgi:glycosyltransferase involved in cell wall biosynthesis